MPRPGQQGLRDVLALEAVTIARPAAFVTAPTFRPACHPRAATGRARSSGPAGLANLNDLLLAPGTEDDHMGLLRRVHGELRMAAKRGRDGAWPMFSAVEVSASSGFSGPRVPNLRSGGRPMRRFAREGDTAVGLARHRVFSIQPGVR